MALFPMKTLALQNETAELLQRLRNLRPDSPRRWGRMSARQMICHLADGFRMATGEKAVTIRSGLLKRTILKWVVLHGPLRWPPGISTCPEIDANQGGTRPLDFAADLAQVVALLEHFSKSRNIDWRPHPLFGRMTEAEWLRWGYLHVDHHLRQFGL